MGKDFLEQTHSLKIRFSADEEKRCMELIPIKINNKEIKIKKGTTILEAARQNNIHIPTLCNHPDLEVAGICRICVVEIEGMKNLQASCAYPIDHPISVKTYTEKVRKARRYNLDLILAQHYGECYNCVRNNNCELQSLSKEYGVNFYRFPHIKEPRYEIDDSSFALVRDPNKCVHCKRCIRTCLDLQEVGVLETAGRGHNVQVQTMLDRPLAELNCVYCGQCINRCPTGALHANDPSDWVWEAIDDPEKFVIIQTAPSPRAAIGEEFGLPAGTSVTGQLNTALHRMGFDRVFDTNFAADLTIMEEGSELLWRLEQKLVHGKDVKIPMITSCSPGWVKFAEHTFPDFLDHLSSCKSPQQMFGAVIKTYYAQMAGIDPANIVTVALMPCAAKKFECNRPEMVDSGYKDIDYGLTTREMAGMIREAGLWLPELPKSDFDHPLGLGSGAGLVFGATGGVMEAAIRSVYLIVTGRQVPFKNMDVTPVRGMEGIREASITFENTLERYRFLEGVTLNVAVAHGIKNARQVIDRVKSGEGNYHFIEIMACPGGCLGGGGQPIPTSPEIREARAQAIYAEDHMLSVRTSVENPEIQQLYGDFLGKPLGHLSHQLLHTHYTPRGRYTM